MAEVKMSSGDLLRKEWTAQEEEIDYRNWLQRELLKARAYAESGQDEYRRGVEDAAKTGDEMIAALRKQCRVLSDNDEVCMAMDVGEQIGGIAEVVKAIRALLPAERSHAGQEEGQLK